MIRKSARNDPSAGCIIMKNLSDIIETTKKADDLDNRVYAKAQPWPYPDDAPRSPSPVESMGEGYAEGYAEGFIDGKAQGFREGLAWGTGK